MDPIPPEALLADHSPERRALANALRDLVRRTVPDAVERVRTGWNVIGYDVPVGRRTRFFAWVWLQPEHVHLGFQNGVLMDDPHGLLAGRGVTKQVRWLTFERLGDIPDETPDLIREAARVAGMSRMERELRRMDLEEAAPSD
jgi:hypothetical protein